MREIHENVLQCLLDIRKNDPTLLFTLRKVNRGNRLDNGYWFHGNDKYLAVSFWKSFDPLNRTPSIYFVVLNDGSTYLEISFSEQNPDREFISKNIIPTFINRFENNNKHKNNPRFRRLRFNGNNYIESLTKFIDEEKKIIDEIIRKYSNNEQKAIFSLSEDDFNINLERITQYRKK
jgi:hypothetical protein